MIQIRSWVDVADNTGARMAKMIGVIGKATMDARVGDIITAMDVHLGMPDEVIASLLADTTLERATDLTMQVHSIDPPHPYILRSIELFAEKVAPALGWAAKSAEGARRVA